MISKSGEVYEIKTVDDLFEGLVQEQYYLALLNSLDPQRRKWIEGATFVPPRIVPINEHAFAIVSPPVRGVIVYQVLDTTQLYELAIVVTVLAVDSFAADISISVTTTAMGGT